MANELRTDLAVKYPNLKDTINCSSVDEPELRRTIQVYLDLAECKDWWNLILIPCDDLNKIFITGHETQTMSQSVVLSVQSDSDLSMEQLEHFKKIVKEKFTSDRFLLAIVAADSSIVYYTIGEGLIPPESPEEIEAKKKKRMRYQTRRKQRHMKFSNSAETMSAKSLLKTSASLVNKVSSQEKQQTGEVSIDNECSVRKSPILSGAINMSSKLLTSDITSKTNTISSCSTNVFEENLPTLLVTDIPSGSDNNLSVSGSVKQVNTSSIDNDFANTGDSILPVNDNSSRANNLSSSGTNSISEATNITAECDSVLSPPVDNSDGVATGSLDISTDTNEDGNQYTVTDEGSDWCPLMAPEDFDGTEEDMEDDFEGEI